VHRCLNAKPNDAHRALATLCLPSTRTRIAPVSASPPLHITQNVDALSLRVLEPFVSQIKLAAEQHLIQMHGSIFATRCTSCQHVQQSYAPVLSSALGDLKAGDGEREIPIAQLPRCGGDDWSGSNRYGNCGGLLRPEVVWFGEVPPLMGEISRKLNWCDMLLVVGTSAIVCPCIIPLFFSRKAHVLHSFFDSGTPCCGFCITSQSARWQSRRVQYRASEWG
jgi:NAD-dependent deacetylase sirtuin 5